MRLFRSALAIVILLQARFSNAADTAFPESMVTLRAQPAVFLVRATADVELVTPRTVSANVSALKSELVYINDDRVTKQAMIDQAWDLIGQNPEKYLLASEETELWSMPNSNGWTGSAFAISREGILLTNAHVVASDSEQPLTQRSWEFLLPAIKKHVGEMEAILGAQTTNNVRIQKTLLALFPYYASRSRVAFQFKSARIVLDYKVDNQKAFTLLKESGIDASLGTKREEISVPVTVLAAGEPLPGKDVAVLKVIFEPEEQARLKQKNEQRKLPGLDAMLDEIQNDRLVCLPLGNVSEVFPQAKVQSLGFPGIAFNPDSMDPESQFKVSSKKGQISQTKRMRTSGGWDIFEMDAATDSGDSGGPVVDLEGRVIAINVGRVKAAPDRSVLCVAIPINIAKNMLKELGIKPDPGRLSAHWDQGLRLFEQKKYEEALKEIQAAITIQKGGSVLSGREASWYLRDMAGRCLQKLGKIPGDD